MQASDIAWEPLTPGGVARFARARPINLLVMRVAVALLAAGAVLWFLGTAWFPVARAAIQQLPAEGAIRSERLAWSGEPAVVLAENHFLAFTVDLKHQGDVRSPAHVQVEFGETNVRVYSLFGLVEVPYPRGWVVAFSRTELGPWWGAWSPALLAIAGVGVILGLFLSWFALSALYCPVAWLIGFFADRELSLRGAWRLAGAALIPGALFLILGILLYGLGALDIVRLLAAFALHFVIGWIYVVASPFWCPRLSRPAAGNPFTPGPPPQAASTDKVPAEAPPPTAGPPETEPGP